MPAPSMGGMPGTHSNPPAMQMPNCPEGQQPVNGACQPVQPAEQGVDALLGTYIYRTEVVTVQTVPLFGDQKNTTTLYGHMNIAKDDAGKLIATEYGCGGGGFDRRRHPHHY